jgi:hypothetical protein
MVSSIYIWDGKIRKAEYRKSFLSGSYLRPLQNIEAQTSNS